MLKADQLAPLLQTLAEAGLTSHETGGNSLRGIMACPHAGLGAGEPFDVSRYAELLGATFVRHPEFQNLPRKMKMGISCCRADCAHTVVQDLGFQARIGETGEPGFRVLVGGGTGTLPRLGQEMLEFLPAGQLLAFTEAFLRMFDRHGERQNKRRSRVKFLVQDLGIERLRELVNEEWRQAGKDAIPNGEVRLQNLDCTSEESGFLKLGFPGGTVSAGKLRKVADLAEVFGFRIRVTADQELLVGGIPEPWLPQLRESLAQAGLFPSLAPALVACPGTTACSNAFTNSRALGDLISANGLVSGLGDCRVCVSGCSNGCTLHAIAAVGLEGVAYRAGETWLPAYKVRIGGRLDAGHPRLATSIGMIAANRVPEFLASLSASYAGGQIEGETFSDFVERRNPESFRPIAVRFHPKSETSGAACSDWGETGPYQPRQASAAGAC